MLTGESGCGKSTLARCLALMEDWQAGTILLEGVDYSDASPAMQRRFRQGVQVVLQSTAAAINPGMSALEAVEEPLVIAGGLSTDRRRAQTLHMLDRVGFPRRSYDAKPGELSGGQRQRLAVARALQLQPKVVILDEALTGLDSWSCNQIVDLLVHFQRSTGLAYLVITHDPEALHLSPSRTYVLRNGQLVSTVPCEN